MDRITLFGAQPHIAGEALGGAKGVGDSSVSALTDKLKEYLGCKYVVLTNSGASALLAAYWILKSEFGSITTCAFTWPRTFQCARVANLEVRYRRFALREKADFSSASLNVLTHLFGQPNPLLGCIGFKPFIEDAAQSFGATYQGKKVGTFGRIGCFSFDWPYLFHTCGDGGALVTDNEEYYVELSRFVNGIATDSKMVDMPVLHSPMDEIKAEYLVRELSTFEKRLDSQRNIAAELLSVVPCEQPLLVEHEGMRHSYVVFNLLLDERDKFRTFMEAEGIETSVLIGEQNLPPVEKDRYADITAHLVAIPCRWDMTSAQVRKVQDSLVEWFQW